MLVYNSDGTERPEIDEYQPTTPLKLCVFRYSDCMLREPDLLNIRNMCTLLIKYGANDFEAAIKLFESRYGKCENYEND